MPPHPQPIAPGIEVIHLEYLNESRSIASVFLTGGDGIAIVDPGPSTALSVVRQRLADRGAFRRGPHRHRAHAHSPRSCWRHRHPRPRESPDSGVRARAAARRIWSIRRACCAVLAASTGTRWSGSGTKCCPSRRSGSTSSGRRIPFASQAGGCGRRIPQVTPGIDVCLLDEASDTAFVGDTAGERYPGERYVLPVTPPPDVDLEHWYASIARVRSVGSPSSSSSRTLGRFRTGTTFGRT